MKLKLGLICAVMSMSTMAFGAIQKGDQIVAVNLGAAMPLGEVNLSNFYNDGKIRTGKTGVTVGAQYLYHVAPRLGLGVDVHLTSMGENQKSELGADYDSFLNSESFVIMGLARVNLATEGRWTPYLLAGLGMNRSRVVIDMSPADGQVWSDNGRNELRTIWDDSATQLALALGAGVDVQLSKRFFVGIETRYQHLGSATYEPTASFADEVSGLKSTTHMVNVLGRIGWKF